MVDAGREAGEGEASTAMTAPLVYTCTWVQRHAPVYAWHYNGVSSWREHTGWYTWWAAQP